jgi:hypothetical protein
MRVSRERSSYDLNQMIESGWYRDDDLEWQLVQPGEMARADTAFGAYRVEVLDDGIFRLTFVSGAGTRICPKNFQTITRIHEEASDHHQRLRAQVQRSTRVTATRW